jgi:predicted dehydrogenase
MGAMAREVTGVRSVGVVGLGTIARTHLQVLADVAPGARVFGVDPRGPSAAAATPGMSVHEDLAAALATEQPDLWVVATPTHTHADLCARLVREGGARVLVEKPLTADVVGLERLLRVVEEAGAQDRVLVAHHFAFSPEVVWAREVVRSRPSLGLLTRITSVFHDPYVRRSAEERASYGSAWTDSGANQLSMLFRWVDDVAVDRVTELDDGARAHVTGRFRCGRGRPGRVLLVSSWLAADSSKRTVLAFDDGDAEVWLDHTAVTGMLVRHGEVVAWLDDDGTTPRKVAHYRPLYASVLSDDPDPVLRLDTAAAVVRRLAAGRGSD